jgi:hypothetical protein
MVLPVISPAGTMTQTARGAVSLLDEVLDRARAGRALGLERLDGIGFTS